MIGIVVSEFNGSVSNKLLESCELELKNLGLEYEVHRVPGAFEIPLLCKKLSSKYKGLIALGCVVKGETDHYDMVCRACVDGIMQVQLEIGKPIVFEVLMVEDVGDALARTDKGASAANVVFKLIQNENKDPA